MAGSPTGEADLKTNASQFSFEQNMASEKDRLLDDYVDSEGYESPKSIKQSDVKDLYTRDNIVHRRVNKQLQDMFGQPPEVRSDNETLREEIEDFLFSRGGLYQKLKIASKHSLLDGICLIHLNYSDQDLKQEPDNIQEIPKIGIIFKRDISKPIIQDEDLRKPNYNEVTHWKAMDEIIHKSRIIDISFDSLYNDPMGISIIEPEFDYHMMRKSVIQDAIKSYHQNASGIKIFKLPEKPSQKDVNWIKENIHKVRGQGELTAPAGTEVEFPAPKVTDPTEFINPLMEMGTSMPYQILVGTSAGSISGSETNLKNYKKEIQNLRKTDINNWISGKIEFLQEKGYFPEGDFELDWGDIFDKDEESQAMIDYRRARAGKELFEMGFSKDVIEDFLGLGGGKAGLSGASEDNQGSEDEIEHKCDYSDHYKDPSRDFEISIDLEEKDKLWDDIDDDEVDRLVDQLDIPSQSRLHNKYLSEMRSWENDIQEEWIEILNEIFEENESTVEKIKRKISQIFRGSERSFSSEIGAEEQLISALIQVTGVGRSALRGILNDLYSEGYMQGWNSVADMTIDEISGYAETWLNNNATLRSQFTTSDLNQDIKDNVMRGIRDGYTTSQLEDRIAENISDYTHRVETLARTELNYSINQGRLDSYEEQGIEEVAILVVQDDRTCEECMELDGVLFDIQEAREILPVHPNCRCVIISPEEYRGVNL